ncbi:MAG: LysM peptidoglycan-binding domain-containing protein [Lentisphaerae bacterium]|nr:LysM peptidoglycan-binding domain-containing protein [Lentisphaerota bacterium]
MKTPTLVGIVVAVHCVAVGSVILIQGCGTTGGHDMESAVVMPPDASLPQAKLPPPSSATGSASQISSGKRMMYVIEKGDTLSGIAKKFGVSVNDIVELNALTNPNMIRLGRTLVLPGAPDIGSAKLTENKETKPQSFALQTPTRTYVVKRGDTLSGIALRHGTSVDSLMRANGIATDRILIGQELTIPEDGKSPSQVKHTEDAKILETDLDSEPVREIATARIRSDQTPVVEVPATVEQPKATPYRVITVENETDDLRTIAMMWVVSIEELKKLNGLTDTKLKRGQKIKVPITEY